MNMLIAIFLNLSVILSAFFMSVVFFKKKNIGEIFLTTSLLAFAQIVIVILCFGIFSKLYYSNIVAAQGAIFIINLLIYLKSKHKLSFNADFSFIFESNIVLLGLSFFSGFYLVLVWFNMINPIPYTDALLYHLPYPVYWLKNANLVNPLVINEYGNLDPCCFNALMYYPVNAEMLFFWLILPLKNAFLAELGQVPFYIIGITAIYLILRKFNINRPTAFLSGFLWALIPNILKQIRSGALIDVIAAVVFLLVVYFLLDFKDNFNFKTALLFGICLGIFIGIKVTCLFWTLSILPFFTYIVWKNRGNPSLFLYLIIIVVSALIFGGRTYIRNLIVYHNIFYPITVTFFGHTIMPGLADKATFSRLIYPPEEFTFRKLFFGEGLGVQFIMFIVPGTLLPLITCSFFKKKFKEFGKYFLFFLVPTLMAYLYFFVMQGFWVRYLFPYLALGLIAMVILLDKFKWGRRYFWFFGCISIFASAAEISKRGQLAASLLISVLLFILFKSSKNFKILKLAKNKKIGIAILLLIIVSLIAVKIESDYDRDVFKKYPHMFSRKERKEADTALGWLWLDENTAGGEKIAYTGRCESYPLFGSHFKNDVFYISINNKPPLPHCYLKGDYRKEKDVLAWKQNLQDKKIDYLFVYQPYNRSDYPIEDEWARADKGMFNLVYENSRVKIYKLKIK